MEAAAIWWTPEKVLIRASWKKDHPEIKKFSLTQTAISIYNLNLIKVNKYNT